MTWHIFLKDLRRLWPFVAGLAAVHFALAIMRVVLGPFPQEQESLRQAAELLNLAANLLLFFTTVMLVQLDPLPGDRQDWLVRPISRRDLILAKLAFVIALLHGPLFLAGLLQGLMLGFPLLAALAAAFWWSFYQFVCFSLIAMAVAALSRTIGQTLGTLLVAGVGAVAVLGGIAWLSHVMAAEFDGGGESLMGWLLNYGILISGAVIILGLQYVRRATLQSRVVLGVFTVLAALSTLLPPQTALAMQAWLSPERAKTVTLAFAPDAALPDAVRAPERRASEIVRVRLPLTVQNLPADLTLVAERVKVTLTAPDGTKATVWAGQDRALQRPGQAGAAVQEFDAPKEFFEAHGAKPVKVTLDYVLGVVDAGATYALPPGGTVMLPQGARCTSDINRTGTSLNVGCLQLGHVHQRLSAALADGSWTIRHLPSDAPYSHGSDIIPVVPMTLPLRDGAPPVVTLTMSKSLAHITRTVEIADVRLADWAR